MSASHIEKISAIKPLLQKLKDDSEKTSFIEYGEQAHPGGLFSKFRIRYINTPGGPQFCIKHLHFGMEGSGQYFHQEELLLIALGAELGRLHYSQSREHLRLNKKPIPELSFFLVQQ